MFSPLRRGWLGLSPTLGVEKTGPVEEQAILRLKHPQIETFNFVRCSVDFQPVPCMFSRFSSCCLHGLVHVSRQCGCHVRLELKVGTRMQGSKNLFSNTRQGGSKRKVLVAKVAVYLKLRSPNRQMHRNALRLCF